jgi:hypothetical protein
VTERGLKIKNKKNNDKSKNKQYVNERKKYVYEKIK